MQKSRGRDLRVGSQIRPQGLNDTSLSDKHFLSRARRAGPNWSKVTPNEPETPRGHFCGQAVYHPGGLCPSACHPSTMLEGDRAAFTVGSLNAPPLALEHHLAQEGLN